MKAAPLLLTLGCLSGCAAAQQSRGVEGPVSLGQVADAGGVRVRPDRLIEDSRCPAATQCVWAGRVVVRATVRTGSGSQAMDLTLGTPVPVADGRLTLTSVEPRRAAGAAPPARAYRFTFAFEGGL